MQDKNCRYILEPGNASLEKDLSGGWFDAGDYNKYVTFIDNAVMNLLGAYEVNPSIFGDDWNLPESGNGVPDILDEIKWELDWLRKMINADGTVIIKMGSQNFNENISSPPSVNTDQRFYGRTCSSAAASASANLAYSAKVYGGISGMESYADDLEDDAIKTWDVYKTAYDSGNIDTDCDLGEIVAGDADRDADQQKQSAVLAAIYLYDLTGDTKYNDFIIAEYNQVEPIVNDWWGPYLLPLNDAMLYYTTLSNGDTNVQNAIVNSATSNLNSNSSEFYEFSDDDLYRAQSPDWIYHWGSNLPKAGIGALAMLFRKYDLNPSKNDALQKKAYEQLHYFHGVNPNGMVHLSNMYALGGDKCVNEIYHTWFFDGTDFDHALNSTFGPAPGFVTGGPNQFYSYAQLSPPSNQPIMKSYLDFNDGWPESSWEISEPAIYYQGTFIRLLASFVNNQSVTSLTNISLDQDCIEVFPNPSSDYFRVTGILPYYTIEILDVNGTLYNELEVFGSEARVNVNNLPAGTFFISVSNKNDDKVCVKKIIKN